MEKYVQKKENDRDIPVFITLDAASQLCSLSRNTVRKRAKECNAARKIGKSFRINRKIFVEYLDSFEV